MVDLYELYSLAKEFDRLGWSVQSQLESVINGEDLEEQNPNALRMIQSFLRRVEEAGIDASFELALIAEYLDEAA